MATTVRAMTETTDLTGAGTSWVVLRYEGTFGADGVTIAWTVVPGSGTGALAGVTGGGYTAGPHAKEWTWRLGAAG
jgi:hypothetical protein